MKARDHHCEIMKRLAIVLLCVTGLSSALAASKPTPVSPVYLNDTPILPPTVPPQVDALTFINRSTFIASNDFLILPLFNPTPYEAQSVIIWTNNGVMLGLPGFRYENTPNPAHMTTAQRRKKGALLSKPSQIFYNDGEITVSDSLRIDADHIISPGVLAGDFDSRFRIFSRHGLADLTRAAVRVGGLPPPDCTSVSNILFGPFFFLTDPQVIEDYNLVNFGISGVVLSNRLHIPVPLFLPNLGLDFAPPNPFPPSAEYAASIAIFPGVNTNLIVTNIQSTLRSCGQYDAFVHVQTNAFVLTNIFGTNFVSAFGRDISVVLVPTNGYSTNVSVDVRFPTNTFGFGLIFSDLPIVQFSAPYFDVIEQQQKTNFLTFENDGDSIFRAHDCNFDLAEAANAAYTADLFYSTNFATNRANYTYTVASLHVGNTNSVYFTNNPLAQFLFEPELGRTPAASDPTNFPGSIEIQAKDLDLTHARLRAENGLLIHATNLIGNESAFLEAPFVSFDVGTTNQNLVISNLIVPQASRLRADLNSWAATWSVNVTNGGTLVPTITTNGVLTNIFFPNIETWSYHVLILGACVDDLTPSITHRFVLHGTNLVVEDNLAINAEFLVDGRSFTLGSNASLTLPRNTSAAFTNFQGIINFTNVGVLNAPQAAYFGAFQDGYVPPPPAKKKKKKTKGPQPPELLVYDNILNHGTISAATVKLHAGYVEDTGPRFFPATIIGSNGVVLIDAGTLIISNAVIQAQSDIRLTAGDLFATHSMLLAGATNVGRVNNFIPGALIIDATNSLTDGGVTATNIWRVTGGVRMVRRPDGANESGTVGDLMGTRIESLASTFVEATHTWAGEDRGPTVEGFTNNLALGRLVLDGRFGNRFHFKSTTFSNALYVDYLELRNDATNYNFAIGVDPDFTIYFADSNIRPEKLVNSGGGRIQWVSDFIGPQSATNITYPNGITYTFNEGLVTSSEIDSDGDGFVNNIDCTPIPVPGFDTSGQQCPPSPSPAVRATAVATTQDLNLKIAYSADGQQVILNWDAPANSANTVEFSESLTSGAWQSLTNFINGPVNARVTVKDAADAPQRVYRVRVDAGKP